ncbi:thioredoxin [Candidatus Peregrinibacteria bacterium CG22_combo_CG10-13_8_21_14_all_44_10]|nr:MAG: thioredoxin [Candidatus Peregrinibacteria bacterium CG22_combo_CG10-13_8_21_14_all_44_10]PJB88816.1 MAG: thioredoxin [Candidatus Peregrinibacteria bacterium CG_4_9_14_0_8_um_filter_44_15]
MAQIFTDQDFDAEVLKAEGLVLVDFFAEWCGPCKMLAPIIDALSEGAHGVKIGKINVDESPETARKYGVMSIPTLIFFKGGEVMEQMVGMKSQADLEAKIAELK